MYTPPLEQALGIENIEIEFVETEPLKDGKFECNGNIYEVHPGTPQGFTPWLDLPDDAIL